MKRILLLSHSSNISGPIDYFEEYLLRNGYDVLKLDHPLDSYNGRESVLTHSKKAIWRKNRKGGGVVNLFLDFLYSLRFTISHKPSVCVGANNFDTFAAIIARTLSGRHIEKVIYFASDFSGNRFNKRLLDRIYLLLEKFVLKRADLVVSNTRRAEARRLELGLSQTKSVVVPNGVYLRDPEFTEKNIDKSSFIFVGNVTREHGLYDLVRVLRPLIKKLSIIAGGDDLQRVVDYCKSCHIELDLHYLKPHEFVVDYLKDFRGFGLAPYNRDSEWTYYCSPLKVNEYIACGVPVVVSDVPEIAEFVENNGLGIKIREMSADKLEEQINNFNAEEFGDKARDFYEQFNYDALYSRINI